MRFGYDVVFHLCLLRKPHNNSIYFYRKMQIKVAKMWSTHVFLTT